MNGIASPVAQIDPNASASAPLWFKAEKFLEADFSPEAYVNDLRRYVPLETLSRELSAHLDTLRARLVEVVNDDYDEFVSLSTKLVDVDGAVARMQRPLAEVKERVEAARGAVAAHAAALQQGLARRQAAAAARALLELAQDAVHVMAKVEKLLEELPSSGAAAAAAASAHSEGGSGTDRRAVDEAEHEEVEGRCRLLDRLCSEVSRLYFYAAKGEELAIVRQMAPRVAQATARLQAALDEALAAVLRAQNPAALGVLLHAYGSLGRPEAAEAVVRRQLVAPLLAATVAKVEVPTPAPGSQAPYLPALLVAMAAALKEPEVSSFLELAMGAPSGPQVFDFLSRAVLPEVLAAVEAAAPGAFSPGLPDAFHANYRAATNFLDELECFCTTPAQAEQLRGSEAYRAYLKKWNLAAYFSLRFQDIAGVLEETLAGAALAPASAPASAEGAPDFAYAATAATWAALAQCCQDDVFLPALADRFLRLALQLVARYASWVQAGLSPGGGRAAAPLEPQTQQGVVEGDVLESNGAANTATSRGWAMDVTVEQLAAVWQDAAVLQASLQASFVPRLAAALGPAAASSGASEALSAAFAESEAQLAAAGDAALAAASAGLVDRCCEALKQLRGIVATFRMTSRAAPSRPSHYVATILSPLQAFLSGAGGRGLGEGPRAALVQAVVEGVSARYCQLADDTLSTVRKTESSLRRLKSRKGGGGGGGEGEGDGGTGTGTASGQDTDKMISSQLFLDIQEFGRKVAGVAGGALQPEQLESYKALWRAVAPEGSADEVAL